MERAGRGRTPCEQVSCEPAARVTSIRKYKTDNPIKNIPQTRRAGTCCFDERHAPQRYEPDGSCTDDTTWRHTHEHSTALVSSRPEQLAVRVQDLPLAPRHLPQTVNNPQAEYTFSSSRFFRPDSDQRCRTCVTCRCVPCVHDSESVPGGTGEPANSSGSASLASCFVGREARRPFPTPPPPPPSREEPHGVHAPPPTTTPSLASSLPPKLWGSSSTAPRIPHVANIRGTKERGKGEKKLSVLSCSLAYEQG